MELVYTLENIGEAARWFWKENTGKKVFAFHGAMGAGKTTFIHALCHEKHVKGAVSSPTFSIINEYAYPGGLIYHIDLYRLKDEAEAVRAGVEDVLYAGQICLVEWPERAPGLFPDDAMAIFLEAVDSQTRRLQIGDK